MARTSKTNNDTKQRRWAWIVLALVALAPIIAGCGKRIPPYWPDLTVGEDTVYVAETNGQVFALAASTGDVVWSYPVIEQRTGGLLGGCSSAGPADGPFFSAPAISEEYVLLGSAGDQQRSLLSKGENLSGLRALNKLGTLQWDYKGTADRTVAPPALAGDTVYLPSSDHHVYAIDLNTREARWVFATENWVWATPLVVEDRVYIASMDHVLYAIQAETGNEVWRFERSTSALPAAPAYNDGILYFGSLSGYVYAIDAQKGSLVWENQIDGGVWATPLIVEDTLYLGTLSGQVYALSTADGAEVWRKSAEGELRGTPAFADGMLYFGCENGQLYAFDADSGQQGVSPLGVQLEKASIYTSPVFDGQHLYVVATDGQVFALDPARNAIVWQTNPLDTTDQEAK